jgi:hypothetical protein
MKIFLGAIIAGLLALGFFPPKAWAQEGGFQFEELDYDRQSGGRSAQNAQGPAEGNPGSQEESDELLQRMFAGEDGSPNAPSRAPSGAAAQDGSFQNLPGEPSPVKPPARPGEARIERSDSAGSGRRAARASDYPPFQRRWFEAEDAWSRDLGGAAVVPCQSLLPNRILYHINCASNLRPGGR